MIKPYYQDEWATIYFAPNEQVLPFLPQFDLLLTDPPYGIGEGNQKRIASRSVIAKSRDYGDADWDKQPPPRWVIQMALSKAPLQIVWGGNYFELPPAKGWLVWDKDNGANDFSDCELAWTNLDMAVRKFKWRWHGMLQQDMANKEVRTHPTQKPLPLMTWCLGHAPTAKTILDPWMGSGTVLRAAKDLGLHAVGIDRVEAYCEAAAKRLQQECLSFAPKPVQALTTGELLPVDTAALSEGAVASSGESDRLTK